MLEAGALGMTPITPTAALTSCITTPIYPLKLQFSFWGHRICELLIEPLLFNLLLSHHCILYQSRGLSVHTTLLSFVFSLVMFLILERFVLLVTFGV